MTNFSTALVMLFFVFMSQPCISGTVYFRAGLESGSDCSYSTYLLGVDIETGVNVSRLATGNAVSWYDVSPNGSRIATSLSTINTSNCVFGEDNFLVLAAVDGRRIVGIKFPSPPSGVRFLDDSRVLISGDFGLYSYDIDSNAGNYVLTEAITAIGRDKQRDLTAVATHGEIILLASSVLWRVSYDAGRCYLVSDLKFYRDSVIGVCMETGGVLSIPISGSNPTVPLARFVTSTEIIDNGLLIAYDGGIGKIEYGSNTVDDFTKVTGSIEVMQWIPTKQFLVVGTDRFIYVLSVRPFKILYQRELSTHALIPPYQQGRLIPLRGGIPYANTEPSDDLLNCVEALGLAQYSPSGQPTRTWQNYSYRVYKSNEYIGVSGSNVYAINSSQTIDSIQVLGTTNNLLAYCKSLRKS